MTNDVDDLLGEIEANQGKPAKAEKPAKVEKAVKAKAPAKKAAPAKAPAKKAAPAKAVKAPAKKAAPAKAVKAVKAVKAPVKKTPAKAVKAPAKKATVRESEFIVFAEGERQELAKQIKKIVRKEMNSRVLAERLGIHSRKLRRVLYGMHKAGTVKVVPGPSRKLGMYVHPV